jgi:predicted nucleic acid-binding Zn ribbon protein
MLCECVLPDTAKEFGFTTASQQMVGQAGLLRLRQNQRRAVILFLVLVLILILLFMRERSDTTKRDLGAG